MTAQKLSAECVAAGPVFTSTPMVPLAYVASVTLICTAPMVRVRVVPDDTPDQMERRIHRGHRDLDVLEDLSAPLTSFEMRSWLAPPEMR